MIKTVLFDLDGTLIETTQIILDTFVETFEKFLPEVKLTNDELTNLLGQTLFKTFEFYTDSQEKLDEIIKYYREVSNQKIENGLKAYPFALETLVYLKKKGATVGVVTSKMRKIATYHLEITGLLPYIDGIIGYEDVLEHKPHPEPIIKALELFGAKKKSTIYVGDHENDIKAAKKAGIYACAVTYSKRLSEMLMEQPEFVIDELINLKDII
ncbi:MAG: HAD-IA family hydrolase [Acholeplasmataceae bacterium]|nr:HAD-IA family hydrolase [Acholeplasmataceae bacterium]